MARWTMAVLVVGLAVPAAAQEAQVLARLPAERRAEMMAALRVELAGRATLIEGEAATDEATDASMRAEAAGATHVVWVVFPGGMLAPAEVRVLDVARSSAARAMTAQAWDVVDPRVVAVLAASLLEPSAPVVVVAPPEPSEAAPPSAPVEPAPAPAPVAVAAPEAPLVLTEPQLGRARPARTFSLWLGMGMAHTTNHPSLPPNATISAMGQTAFYGRVSEWASIGLRLRASGGYSNIEGGILQTSIGVPSIMVGFRESLGTAAAIELGMHAEGNLYIDWVENRRIGADQLSFGLGVGVFAVLELGRANGIALDYTIELYGLGGTDTWLWGSGTLSYVHRWN